MLKKDRFKFLVLICFLIGSCKYNNKKNLTTSIKEKSIEVLGTSKNYNALLQTANDTVQSWVVLNYLIDSSYDENPKFGFFTTKYKIDSTFCINTQKNKIIGTLFDINHHTNNGYTYGITEFYGAKIKEKWYFWRGGYTPIFKDNKNNPYKKALSYNKLKSFVGYGGYLDENGKIRDEWFEERFKGPGWVSFKDRYEYKSNLDGNRIDKEKEFWEYLWKRKGISLWIFKETNDSIVLYNKLNKKQLTDEQKREIGYYISSKMVNELP